MKGAQSVLLPNIEETNLLHEVVTLGRTILTLCLVAIFKILLAFRLSTDTTAVQFICLDTLYQGSHNSVSDY